MNIGRRSRRLERMYRSFNRAYFDNALPRNIPVAWIAGKHISGHMAQTWKFCDGRIIIVLNQLLCEMWKKLSWSAIACNSLLHEMVHIQHQRSAHHGPAFNKTMLRLAKDGAFRWADVSKD